MRSTLTWITAGALLTLGASASATTLTFDGLGLGNYGAIPTNLGSNANAVGNGYVQGSGWTPDVTVSMSTVDGAGAQLNSNLSYWNTSYGDLVDVAFPVSNGSYGRVTMTGTNGFLVSLNSFDLAGYSQADLTATRIRVLDGNGAEVWSSANLTVNGAGPSHSSYAPNLVGSQFTLEWGNNWNIGLDNLNFTQTTVPEPATMAFLSLGAMAILKRRRKS